MRTRASSRPNPNRTEETSMTTHRTAATAATAGLIAALALAGSVAPASAAPTDVDRPDRAAQAALIAEVRAATASFHDVDAAIAAGYLPSAECSSSPDGAMGYHFVNPALIAPGAPVDPTQPQVLTYGPSASGELELWSAEFFEPDIGQARPMLGTQPFDGPMAGHEPGMPEHYDLHVWIGKHNPAGLYAPFNPSLSC
jgi:hypothetical protein